MRTPRIFADCALQQGEIIQLQGQAGHYLGRVLRRGPGDFVRLFNGRGGEYQARVATIHRGSAELEVLEFSPGQAESPLRIHLGLVISKGDRMDWAVQKATELGLAELTPLTAENCDVKLAPERMEKKCQHWQQIAISACEQSGRCSVPIIHPALTLTQWLQEPGADLQLVFDASGKSLRYWSAQAPGSLQLLVGPEGGLTSAELAEASVAGFVCASLGPRILRTETVPVAALALTQFLWGDG
jgi:16S rRNA (uracil1498-N3)-methyltransferase